jgi:hypothetical protein
VINVVGGIGVQQTPAATFFGAQLPGGTTYQYEMYVDIGAPPANDNCANAVALTTSPVLGEPRQRQQRRQLDLRRGRQGRVVHVHRRPRRGHAEPRHVRLDDRHRDHRLLRRCAAR